MAPSSAAIAGLAVHTIALSKQFGREQAVESLDLRIPEGAVFLLIGANGAGKSTTLRLLLNLERADTGAARVFGLDTVLQAAQVRAQTGYVPERHEPGYRWMTCDRLLQHVACYYPSWDQRYVGHLIDALSLRVSRKIGALSKGELRRLQFVMALAHRPPLLMLDEPTDGFDPIVRRRALELLAEHLADTPTTVLISTHQISEVESLADHIGVMRHGRLVTQLSRQELQLAVRSYRLDVPDGWKAPPDVTIVGERRPRTGRQVQWTLLGNEREVTERLILSGAQVHDTFALTLEDAALALLAERTSP